MPHAPLDRLRRALDERVRVHRLANGWTVILVPKGGVPALAFHTYVAVGACDEPDGLTGMSHMFEHMAFKGSDRVGTRDWPAERAALEREELAHRELREARASGSAERIAAAERAFAAVEEECARCVDGEAYSRVLEEAGGAGTLNASTSADATRYVVSLPSQRIELWCWMERERFGRTVLREFYREREAVREERRMRVESSPPGMLYEQLLEAAFAGQRYRRPVIGYAADIEAYTRPKAEAYWRAHYGARRSTSALVGELDAWQALDLCTRYLGDLPAGAPPEPLARAAPEPLSAQRIEVRFPASSPRAYFAWRVPALGHADAPACEIALRLLGYARSSRLERGLVRERGLASHVGVANGLPGNRAPNLALVSVLPVLGVEPARIEDALQAEIDRLAQHGPSAAELEGVRTVARAELLRTLASQQGLAGLLCEYQAKLGHWRALLDELEAFERVGRDELCAALRRYFRAEQRISAWLLPAPAAAARAPEHAA